MGQSLSGLRLLLRGVHWRQAWGEMLRASAARASAPVRGGERWLMRWALICLLLGVTLYLFCGYHAGFERLNGLAAVYPAWMWQWLTALGDERVICALALMLAPRHPRLLWALLLGALVAVAYSRGLKIAFDALRPPAILAPESFNLIGPPLRKASFPSGHSVTAALFFGVLIYHSRWIELRILWLLIAVLVGLSRVAVGVHWPVDVAFGLMGGAGAAAVGGWLAARWPAPATSVALHMTLVALLLAPVASLLVDDGGYPSAALMMALLGALALIGCLLRYLIAPAARVSQDGV